MPTQYPMYIHMLARAKTQIFRYVHNGGPTHLQEFIEQAEGIRVGQVCVGRGNGQDQTALLGDELQQHVSDLMFDILWLVTHSHLGHPRQIDQGQVKH